jgi:hypothetical protein
MIRTNGFSESITNWHWLRPLDLIDFAIKICGAMPFVHGDIELVSGEDAFEVFGGAVTLRFFIRKVNRNRKSRTLGKCLHAVTSAIELPLHWVRDSGDRALRLFSADLRMCVARDTIEND